MPLEILMFECLMKDQEVYRKQLKRISSVGDEQQTKEIQDQDNFSIKKRKYPSNLDNYPLETSSLVASSCYEIKGHTSYLVFATLLVL